jgi:hypothetical protein
MRYIEEELYTIGEGEGISSYFITDQTILLTSLSHMYDHKYK